jgi:chromosome segregation ATPase
MDWPTAVTILGAITLVVGALLRYFKRDFSWREPVQTLERRITSLEAKIENLEIKIGSAQDNTQTNTQNIQSRLDKCEQKIEKLTDIMIKYISDKGQG